MKRFKKQRFFCYILLPILTISASLHAHHFKGLPHYNYFENYPQIPEDEFLGQVGQYEISLVVYDFQGINRELVEEPENVRLYLVIFDMRSKAVYGNALQLDILDRGEIVFSKKMPSAELENIYSIHQKLPETGKYALRITFQDGSNLETTIPFILSSQKIHWGKWISLSLAILIIVAAIGARKARINLDRKEAKSRQEKLSRKEETAHG